MPLCGCEPCSIGKKEKKEIKDKDIVKCVEYYIIHMTEEHIPLLTPLNIDTGLEVVSDEELKELGMFPKEDK